MYCVVHNTQFEVIELQCAIADSAAVRPAITTGIGLLFIGSIQSNYGWASVWYFLILSTLLGCAMLGPTVHKELFHHDEEPAPVVAAKQAYQAVKGDSRA
eukprot:13580-Heterococcus_DN1.PRE.1